MNDRRTIPVGYSPPLFPAGAGAGAGAAAGGLNEQSQVE